MHGVFTILAIIVMYWLVKSQFKSLFSRQGKSFLHREIARKDMTIKAYKLRVAYLEMRLRSNGVHFDKETPAEASVE